MSRVYVLAADRELSGLEPLSYYRQAVEELDYPMKPFRYELSMENKENDLEHLRTCLEANFSPGETLELWSVWVGDVNKKCPPRRKYRDGQSSFSFTYNTSPPLLGFNLF